MPMSNLVSSDPRVAPYIEPRETVAAAVQRDDEAFNRYRNTKFFAALDGLRCFSILGVIAFHSGLSNPSFFGARGGLGVTFFFVISGFLITTLLLRERSANGEISLRNFYIRRSLRILPMYFATIALYCAVAFVIERHAVEAKVFYQRLPIFLTFTSNWFMPPSGHFALSWSLSTEEQFYLFWPLVLFFARGKWTPLIVIASLALSDQVLEIMAAAGAINLGENGNRIITSVATPICIGCVVAYALHFRPTFGLVYRTLQNRRTTPAAMLGAIGLSCLFPTSPMVLLDQSMLLLFSLIAAIAIASCCLGTGGLFTPLLCNPVARHIGMISYGMYLLHQLCLKAVHRVPLINNVPGGLFVFGTALAVVAASVSYYVFEKRFLALKDRWASHKPLSTVQDPIERPSETNPRRPIGAAA